MRATDYRASPADSRRERIETLWASAIVNSDVPLLPPTVGGSGLKPPEAAPVIRPTASPADSRRERIETAISDTVTDAYLLLPPTVGGSGLKLCQLGFTNGNEFFSRRQSAGAD